MKKIRIIMSSILLAAVFATTVSPAYTYADTLMEPAAGPVEEGELTLDGSELFDEEDIDIIEPEIETEDIDDDIFNAVPEEATEVSSEARAFDMSFAKAGMPERPAVAYTAEITKIDTPEKSEYSFGRKPIYAALMTQLPQTLKVWHNDESKIINIIWKCEDDYNKELDEYRFVPDLEGYDLAKDVEVPEITVTFEKEEPRNLISWEEEKELGDYEDIDLPVEEEGDEGLNTGSLPSEYDGYYEGKMPALRDQNPYGTCWAHSTIACMELDLIHDKVVPTSINLSELQQVLFSVYKYKDPKGCRKDYAVIKKGGRKGGLNQGGMINTGTHQLENLIGAVTDKQVPYSKALSFKPQNRYLINKDVYQLDRAYFYNTEDRNGIKKAVLEHGGVQVHYWDSSLCYSYYGNCYYNPWKPETLYQKDPSMGGHAVTIVGWDDSFSRNNFWAGTPKGDGAWLIRNSWGGGWLTNYCREGYFWMSYYDKGLIYHGYGKGRAVAYDAQKAEYNKCYAYDGGVNYDTVKTVKSPATAKTTFKVTGGEAVKEVGFEVGNGNVDATITVKNTKTGKKAQGSVHCTRAGFYSVKLNKYLYVPKKATVELTIRYKSKSSNKVKVICEKKTGDANRQVNNVRFHTYCDKGFTLNGKKVKLDPRMKLYTVKKKEPVVKVKSVSLNKKTATVQKGNVLNLKATVLPKNATNKKVSWKSSKNKVATVSSKGAVRGKSPGKATITVTTKDGRKKASCTVTVTKKKKK